MIGDMQKWTPNIAGIIEHAKKIHPKSEIISKLTNGEIHRTNYDEVCLRSRKLASKLCQDGYKEGDVLATLALNTFRHLEIYYGVSGMGGIVHTLNFRLHPDQAKYIINHAEDKIIFLEVPFVPILEALKDDISSVEKFILLCDKDEIPETSLKNVYSYEEYIEDGKEDFDWPSLKDDAACGLCYTSGTTGNPKGVLYSHKSTILHAASAITAMSIDQDDSILMVVPMFHVMAWGIPYYGPMLGNKIVMPGMHMDGESLYTLINEEEVTMAAGVPTIWMQLLAYCRENNKKLTALKNTIIGGSALSLAILKEFDEFHDVNVVHAWGMTEMSPLGTTNVPTRAMESMTKEDKYNLQLKQGRPCFGVELKITNDKGDALPNDGKSYGHLLVRGPWILQKYFKSDENAVDSDGWFDTGDISTIDSDGYMTIVDRSKDVIKSGGEWISSIDLENAAVGHEHIAEACVVGVRHPKWDERPILLVVANENNVSKDEINKFLSDKVAKWWLPDDIIFVDELPHGATGKLLKVELRDQYSDHLMEK